MSDFPTMDPGAQSTLRSILSGQVTRAGVFKVKIHCASCGAAIETTRSELAAGEPPVWETNKHGITVFCPEHQPRCPGCDATANRLLHITAWTGTYGGEINGLVCEDCASSLQRRLAQREEQLYEESFDPPSDEVPSFRNHGDAAWRLHNPVARFLTN